MLRYFTFSDFCPLWDKLQAALPSACHCLELKLHYVSKKMVLDASRSRPSSSRGLFCYMSKRKHFNFFFNDIFSHQETMRARRALQRTIIQHILKGSNEIFLTPDKWCPKSFSLSKNDCERRRSKFMK